MKALLTGNEAIARGAWEAGLRFAAAYPGTPSTEILENIATYDEIMAQWSPNEKVALEVAIGASIGGARSLCAMKHVGVNVAADPLFSLSYMGVNGGFVLVSADDPGMHSSQNEQDNRYYAKMAKMPMFEPSDSQEAKDMVMMALALSEEYDTPVLLRMTTRISHSKSLVELGERKEVFLKDYYKQPAKYNLMPANARVRHNLVEARQADLADDAEHLPFNRTEWRDKSVGIITSGISYQYVREVFPQASVLKLGLTNPLPLQMIRDFAAEVERVIVVEELEPFLEEQVRALGIQVTGKDVIPCEGELNPDILRARLLDEKPKEGPKPRAGTSIPVRPPVLCPGCPHRGVFHTLHQLNLTVFGDIGCYTLGAMPPLDAMDTCICMGASITAGLGMVKARPELAERAVAVIGDSTFLHSGMTGLLDVVYNGGKLPVIILDNRTTAMTGHQDNPATGKNLKKEQTKAVDFVALVKALGVNRVTVVDPFQMDRLREIIKADLAAGEPSVIVARRPCALITKQSLPPLAVDAAACSSCRSCLRLGCPALGTRGSLAEIDPSLCTGCGLCAQVCKFNAIAKVGEAIG